MKIDRKKYPNLFRYANRGDLGPGGGSPAQNIDWDLLPLEEAAYELECELEQIKLDQEKEKARSSATAALQQQIEQLKQELPKGTLPNHSVDHQDKSLRRPSLKRTRDRRMRLLASLVHWRNETVGDSIDSLVIGDAALMSKQTYYNYSKEGLVYSQAEMEMLGTSFNDLWSKYLAGKLESTLDHILKT
jgi:hypothetical protein